jgi:hypothetical protein
MVDITNKKDNEEKEEEEKSIYSRIASAIADTSGLLKNMKLLDNINNQIKNSSNVQLQNSLAGKAFTKAGDISEQVQRTVGGAAFDVGQESLQLANLIADKTNLYDYDDELNDRQQEVLQNVMTSLFGEESVETVKRGKRDVVKIKEPEYFGGSFVRDMGSIIGSVVAGTKGVDKVAKLSMRTKTGKELAESIGKSKVLTPVAKTLKTATGATIGEQISINPYEERLANFLGQVIEDDDGTFSDLIKYLEADEDKTELENRLGVFYEGLAFTVGLPAAFFGSKAVKDAFKDKTSFIDTMKSLRNKVQSGDLDSGAFKSSVDNSRVLYSFPYIPIRGRKLNIEGDRAPLQNTEKKILQEKDEDISKLWQFGGQSTKTRAVLKNLVGDEKAGQILRGIATFGEKSLGIGLQEFIRSRGFMTPKMFEVFNQKGAAKNAWVDATENLAKRLDTQIKNLSSKYAKYADPTKLEEKINALLQNPELAGKYNMLKELTKEGDEGLAVSKRLKDAPLSNEAKQEYIEFFKGIPSEMIDDLGGVRMLIDDFSELFLQMPNNQISKDLKETISNNIGSWLHRSYEVFESPYLAKKKFKEFKKFRKKLSEGDEDAAKALTYYKDFDSAFNYMYKQIESTSQFKNADEGAIVGAAFDKIETILKNISDDATGDYFGRMDNFYGANRGIFKRRGDIDEPLRDLLGEIKSPTVNILKSVGQISSFVEDTRFASEAYAMLKGRIAKKGVPKFTADPKPTEILKGRRVKGHIFSRAFVDEATGIRYTTQLKGKQYGALNGKWMTEEMASMFGQRQGLLGGLDRVGLYKNFLAFKGYAQASKTVFNHITHLRNTIGGAIFTLANGTNPFSKDSLKAGSAIWNRRFKDVGKEEALNYYNKLISLDVVNSGVKYGEVENLLRDASESGVQQFTARHLKNLGSMGWAKRKAGQIGEKIQNAYIAEDDLFKIISFENELGTLINAAKKSTFKIPGQRGVKSFDEYIKVNPNYMEQLEREAARVVRDTIPTYSLVPTGIKQLRKLPFGNFFSFPAEMVRTSIGIAKQIGREITSGNEVLRTRGYKRFAGFTAVAGLGSESLSQFTKMWHGVTDEEEEALRNVNPYDYSKNSKFIYYRDKDGQLYKNDFSFIDPYDYIKRPIQTALYEFANGKYTEEDMDKMLLNAVSEGLYEATKPFVSEALLTQSIGNIVRGKTSEGYPIEGWDRASISEKAMLSTYELYKAFVPGSLREIPKTVKASMGDEYTEVWGGNLQDLLENVTTGRTGKKEYTLKGQLIANLTGLRFEKVDINLDLERKAKKYLREFDDARQDLGDGFGEGKTGNDVLRGMFDANQKHYYAYKELKMAFDAVDKLGMDSRTRSKILKDNGVSVEIIKALGRNKYRGITPSETQFKKFQNENNTNQMGLRELQYYTSKYSRIYDSLPMLNIRIYGEEDTMESELERGVSRKQLELVREPSQTIIPFSDRDVEEMKKERLGKVTGGIVEGPDVPFTKEDPSERINPFTGEPYMEGEEVRRVFYEGGSVVIEEFDNPENITDEFLEDEQNIIDEIGKSILEK